MKTLILYDSAFGNTRKVAESIGQALSGSCKVLSVKEARAEDMIGVDRLIVGSPTQNGKPTAGVTQFLGTIPASALQAIQVAAFDTRLPSKLAGLFGFAALRIQSELARKGGTEVSAPAGFYVKGQRGPLKENELERAVEWARALDGQAVQDGQTPAKGQTPRNGQTVPSQQAPAIGGRS